MAVARGAENEGSERGVSPGCAAPARTQIANNFAVLFTLRSARSASPRPCHRLYSELPMAEHELYFRLKGHAY